MPQFRQETRWHRTTFYRQGCNIEEALVCVGEGLDMREHRRFVIAQLFLEPSKRRSMRPTLFMDDSGLQFEQWTEWAVA